MTNLENVKNILGENIYSQYEKYMSENGQDATQRLSATAEEDGEDFDAEYVAKVISDIVVKYNNGTINKIDDQDAEER